VWPGGHPETFCTDHWRCRFTSTREDLSNQHVIDLLQRVHNAGLEIIKTEHLITFDGVPGFTMGQGQ
jgi:isocitrate dehydrogenase